MQKKEMYKIHGKIAERYEAYCTQLGIEHDDRLSTTMDLDAVAKQFPEFGWQELLDADDWNFCHDIGGIKRHIDRPSGGKLTGCFVPRFANAGKAVTA